MIRATGFVTLLAGVCFAQLLAAPVQAGGMAEPTDEPVVVVDPAPIGEDDGMVYAGGDPDFDESTGGAVIDGDEGDDLADGSDLVDGDDSDQVEWDEGDLAEGNDASGEVLDDPNVVYYMTGGPEVQREAASPSHGPSRVLLADRLAAHSAAPPAAFCRTIFAQGEFGDCGWIYAHRTQAD